jgi:hypothetical protein
MGCMVSRAEAGSAFVGLLLSPATSATGASGQSAASRDKQRCSRVIHPLLLLVRSSSRPSDRTSCHTPWRRAHDRLPRSRSLDGR